MSRTGQAFTRPLVAAPIRPQPEGPERPVVAFARDYPDGEHMARHRHDHAQLVYASAGLMRVQTAVGVWVVPPQRAVWIPARIEHEITCIGPVAMRTVYVLPDAAPWLPAECRVMAVPPLLRELVMAVMALPRGYSLDGPEGRLVEVLLDRIRADPVSELHLPMPRDRRLRVVTDGLVASPADARTLDDWARVAGASARTLARRFLAETGLSFRAWRQQLRLHEALARLSMGESVTGVAYEVGYDSPSAFIAMFRRLMGATPTAYFAQDGGNGVGGGKAGVSHVDSAAPPA